MDLIIYMILLLVLGYKGMSRTKHIPDGVGISNKEVVMPCELPIGSNLQLMKEPEAYTKILKQFNLR